MRDPNRFLITGGTGYIGQAFAEMLRTQRLNYTVIGRKVDDVAIEVSGSEIRPWTSIYELIDILNECPDTVIINLAGLFVSNHNPEDINNLVDSNFLFPIEIFEALRISKAHKLVNIGTSWEYNDVGNNFPRNLYAQIKKVNANTASWYTQKYDLKCINLKLNDTFGANDTRKKLMPYLKDCWMNDIVAILNTPLQQINLLYIEDVLDGLRQAAKIVNNVEVGKSQKYFLYSDNTCTIGDLIELVNQCCHKKIKVQYRNQNFNPKLLDGVWRDAPRLPGWKPSHRLENAIVNYFEG